MSLYCERFGDESGGCFGALFSTRGPSGTLVTRDLDGNYNVAGWSTLNAARFRKKGRKNGGVLVVATGG